MQRLLILVRLMFEAKLSDVIDQFCYYVQCGTYISLTHYLYFSKECPYLTNIINIIAAYKICYKI